MTGMDVLYAVKEKSPDVPIVFMTAHGSIDTAVEAMRHGAQDFLIKPCEADRLRVTVNNAIRKASKLKNDVDNKNQNYQGFIGSSQTMQAVYRTIDSAASSKASILLPAKVVQVKKCARKRFMPRASVEISHLSPSTVRPFRKI